MLLAVPSVDVMFVNGISTALILGFTMITSVCRPLCIVSGGLTAGKHRTVQHVVWDLVRVSRAALPLFSCTIKPIWLHRVSACASLCSCCVFSCVACDRARLPVTCVSCHSPDGLPSPLIAPYLPVGFVSLFAGPRTVHLQGHQWFSQPGGNQH
jgi:hypothetical protein